MQNLPTQSIIEERRCGFVETQREIERQGKKKRVSAVTSGLALHRVMKPFNWSNAAFGRDAENDMFNSAMW